MTNPVTLDLLVKQGIKKFTDERGHFDMKAACHWMAQQLTPEHREQILDAELGEFLDRIWRERHREEPESRD